GRVAVRIGRRHLRAREPLRVRDSTDGGERWDSLLGGLHERRGSHARQSRCGSDESASDGDLSARERRLEDGAPPRRLDGGVAAIVTRTTPALLDSGTSHESARTTDPFDPCGYPLNPYSRCCRWDVPSGCSA